MNPAICPECGNADPERVTGLEVQGVYDGVLYWACGECRHAWPRWTHEEHRTRAELAEKYANKHNERIAALRKAEDDHGAGPSNYRDHGRY